MSVKNSVLALNIKMYRRILSPTKCIFSVLIISGLFYGCADTDKKAEAIEKIEIDLQVYRFEREFANVEPIGLSNLKQKYPYLFPAQYADSVWIAKLSDSIQLELFSEVGHAFDDFDDESDKLDLLFKHIKFYFPNYNIPKIITVTSEVDYNNRIILTDSLLLIGLDNYLGADHRFYRDIPKYIAKGLDRQYLVSDIASAFAKQVVPRPQDRTFLSHMIYYGKELYLKDKIIPFDSDAQKIQYTEDELTWAKKNEEPIWRNFIAQEYLYSTENTLDRRFLDPAPFSKFGLELDNESPGRIGRYMGWQIVRSFMENNEVSLQQMLRISAEELFKQSKYKPKK